MRIRLSAVAVALLVACSDETKNTAVKTAPTEEPKVTQAAAAAAVPAEIPGDRLAARYETVRDTLASWDGDQARVEDAREMLKGIVAEDRNYAPAYIGLAKVEALAGFENDEFKPEALDRAEKFINHAIKLQPESFEAHTEKAWIMRYRGDFDLAEESLRRAEQIKPGHPEIKLVRAGIVLEQGEDLNAAVKMTREVISEATDEELRSRALTFMVIVYEAFSHNDEADTAHREIVAMRPKSAWAHGNYAGFLLRRDDIDGAIREGEAAVAIRKYKEAEGVLAMAYIRKAQQMWEESQIQQSAAYIEKVRGVAGDNPNLMFALGQFYETAAIRGRDRSMRQKAVEAYRRALELDPKYKEAELALERLSPRT